MATDRRLLRQALEQAQNISRSAESGKGFDPRGGIGVLAAQLGTAGIGAFAQNRARKKIAEEEKASQEAFATQFPQFAGLSGQLTPETRQAVISKLLSGQIAQQFEPDPTPLSPEGKKESDIRRGLLPEGTTLEDAPDLEKRKERVFKQTKDLRQEFTKNSGEFLKQRDAFSRIQASSEDPSAAGDLALIFNYMKLLDPGSTVREGEFATAAQSASLPQVIVAKYNKMIKGERLEAKQRDDFTDRANRLFSKAQGIHENRINQFSGIAERNKLPIKDVLLDFVGGIGNQKKKEEVAQAIGLSGQTESQNGDKNAAIEELKRRGLIQ